MGDIKNPVIVITKRAVLKNENRDMTIDYPIVFDLKNYNAEEKINNTIMTVVKNLIKEQEKLMKERGFNKFITKGWFELKSNERGILSLSISNYTYPYPGVEGLTIDKSITFSIQSGKDYSLSEMFKGDSDYVEVLSDIIKKQIRERNIVLIRDFEEIKPDQDYYIADKSLIIYFQTLEYTPRYYGPQFFPISVYEIQDIVKENSPLDIMSRSYA